MLTWPHADTDWADQLAAVEAVYRTLAQSISRFEPVLIVCPDARHRNRVAELLAATGTNPERIAFGIAASNDTWSRDHGPISVKTGDKTTLVDFRFNGWGGKYPAALDDKITTTLHRAGVLGTTELDVSELVLEGGAIETDGQGTLLAVARTLLDEARNPGWTRRRVEQELKRLLGIERCLWLEHGGLNGDDTDGHIDTLARFCRPDTICYVRAKVPGDPDFEELQHMEQELRVLSTKDGDPYRLAPLPQPAPIHDEDGRRLPASYANFLIVNGALLLPVFADPADQVAARRLARLFPEHEILPVDCRPLLRQGGSLHCITMQLPAGIQLTIR